MKNQNNEVLKITLGNKILVPEFEKLQKMEKLLSKVESDISKRIKDLDRSSILDTMKKTSQLYQLILGELHFQLGELKLDKYTSIIQKIFSGQNMLLEIILKIKINTEQGVDQQLSGSMNSIQAKSIQRTSSAERDANQSDRLITPRLTGLKSSTIKKQTVVINQQNDKKLIDKATDTELDRQDAKRLSQINFKQMELNSIAQELNEASDDVSEFLKNRKNINIDASNAEKQLKQVLKDLAVKKKRAEQIEQEGYALLSKEENLKQGYQIMENELVSGLKDVALKAKQAQEFQLKQNFKLARENIEGVDQSVQTEKDLLKERYDKLMLETKAKDKKLADAEKKIKEQKKDYELQEQKAQKLQQKVDEYQFQEKKREDESRKVKKEKDLIIISQQEKERLKRYIEENIKLKIKMKDILDNIKQFQDDTKSNFDRFRRYIMSTNLNDEQKKAIIQRAEELFKFDLNKRFNIKELEVLCRFESDMIKDSLIKELCGQDATNLVKKIKQEQKMKEQERLNNPNYDQDFDPELLEEGQKIIIKKTKKKIQRMNSRGEWVEEEIEIEEEVVVDKNGNEIRKREKPQSGIYTDPSMIEFINKHGGLAIGGSKFILPQKPSKPVSMDGSQIKEGEWFTDKKGNKVKMVKNQNGEEEYEIEEKYLDENGIERTRIKKMKVKQDANGEEYTEEVYVDPSTGQKMHVIKKVIKDKDGNDIIEEITTDENGNKIVKRTKVKKDKDGNDVIEEEIIDQYGNKQIVKTKRIKDANGNDVIVKEIINADGTKVIVTEKIDKNGQRIIIEEKIDKNGKKTKIEKKIVIGADGKPVIEETITDEKGNKIVKKTNLLVDENGNSYTQEVTVDAQGNKVIKNIRQKVDQDGNKYTEEEIINQDGTKTIVKKKVDSNGNQIIEEEIIGADGSKKKVIKKVDQFGNQIIEEEIINADGTKRIIKKKIDKNGNQIEEEEIIDQFGNKIIIKKTQNKDGTVTEERINLTTGEKTIIKKKIDESGREIIEETTIDANGKSTTKKKIVTKDMLGNTYVEETYVDPNTGETITVKKKMFKGKDGKEIVEEQIIDSKGNVKNIKKKVFRDSQGREITEQEIIGADGKKYTVKKVVYQDSEGNRIEEEEIIDSQGNKVIIKKKIGADGKQIIEETKISKDGKKTVTHQIINKDGTIEETVIDSNGKVTKRKLKLGTLDKEVQVEILGSFNSQSGTNQLKSILLQIGCPPDKVDELVDAILKFITKGEAIVVGDTQKIANKINEKGLNLPGYSKLPERKTAKKGRKSDDEDEDKLEQLDGLNEEQLVEALFKKMNQKKGELGDLLKTIRGHFGKQNDEDIGLEDFKKYFKKFAEVHLKCGENCPHLRRFYERLGFTWAKYRRRYLKLKDTRIQAFNKIKDQEPPEQQYPIKNAIRNSSPEKSINQTISQSAQKSQTQIASQRRVTNDEEIDKQSWNNYDSILSKEQLNSSLEQQRQESNKKIQFKD
ncbi:hypothetical protein ABPG72_004979 [Tetrahymena utriculariae]